MNREWKEDHIRVILLGYNAIYNSTGVLVCSFFACLLFSWFLTFLEALLARVHPYPRKFVVAAAYLAMPK